MRSRLPIILYVLALIMAPLVDAGGLTSLVSSQGLLLLIVAAFGWFSLPTSTWWRLSLFGGLWQDLYLLTPTGMTIVSIAVLGVVLSLMSGWLTSRTFLTDAVTVFIGLSAALLSQIIVRYLSAQSAPWHLWVSAFSFSFVAALAAAFWVRRDVEKHHQYLR